MLRFGKVCGALFISLLVLSCSTESTIIIEISTSGCYKSCPVFDLKLDNDTIYLNLIKKTQKKGYYRYVLNKKEHSKIKQMLSNVNIHKLQDEYSSHKVDMQVYNTMLLTNQSKKEVFYYEGEAPVDYQKLINYLIQLGNKATIRTEAFETKTRKRVKILDIPIPPMR